MRYLLFITLLAGFILQNGVANAQAVRLGERSDEVKAIQQILKNDPAIYPQGYTTGYFGKITEDAIKRLQAKYQLPQTGTLDESTEKVIFPYFIGLTIESPNGGEVWDRNQIQTIRWRASIPVTEKQGEIKAPFWNKASIDLYAKEKSVCIPEITCPDYTLRFVGHISTVNIFDQAYSWNIGSDIPNGDNYIVRISTGLRILPCMVGVPLENSAKIRCLQERLPTTETPTQNTPTPQPVQSILPPTRLVWDDSDKPFTITGTIIQPTPTSTTTPLPSPTPDLTEAIQALEKVSRALQSTINELLRVIELLKSKP